jgi:hypothetical protein
MRSGKELQDHLVTIIHDALALTEASKTNSNVAEVCMTGGPAVAVFNVSAKIVTGAVKPGTGKTVTVNGYWSDEPVAAASVAAQLAASKETIGTLTLTDTAALTLQWQVNGSPVEVKGKFLYLTIDQDALDTGATLTLTMRLSRVGLA